MNVIQVFLVRKTTGKEGGQIFAMKVLKKVSLFVDFSFIMCHVSLIQVSMIRLFHDPRFLWDQS